VAKDERATVSVFLEAARQSTVVHFAGHAVSDPELPFRSSLLLAPTAGRTGTLHAEELVAELEAPTTRLVVLAACSSAGGAPIGPEGLSALVRPFFAAGVPGVVGSLWNVGDETTKELLVEFHRHFMAGEDAASALRSAQLALLKQQGSALQTAYAWAPFQVIGYASSPASRNIKEDRREPQ
jgi:CHAT domain-containing protein